MERNTGDLNFSNSDAKFLFDKFALENKEYLNENEFYKLVEYFFTENNDESQSEIVSGIKQENYFNSKLKENNHNLTLDDFQEVYTELIVIKSGGLNFDLNIELEEADLEF
jgi:hypothetical protein